ncbi:hypothetical protein Tco_1549499, partial [Tanacetum coccineum]
VQWLTVVDKVVKDGKDGGEQWGRQGLIVGREEVNLWRDEERCQERRRKNKIMMKKFELSAFFEGSGNYLEVLKVLQKKLDSLKLQEKRPGRKMLLFFSEAIVIRSVLTPLVCHMAFAICLDGLSNGIGLPLTHSVSYTAEAISPLMNILQSRVTLRGVTH